MTLQELINAFAEVGMTEARLVKDDDLDGEEVNLELHFGDKKVVLETDLHCWRPECDPQDAPCPDCIEDVTKPGFYAPSDLIEVHPIRLFLGHDDSEYGVGGEG